VRPTTTSIRDNCRRTAIERRHGEPRSKNLQTVCRLSPPPDLAAIAAAPATADDAMLTEYEPIRSSHRVSR
jgi:hypothetical protein